MVFVQTDDLVGFDEFGRVVQQDHLVTRHVQDGNVGRGGILCTTTKHPNPGGEFDLNFLIQNFRGGGEIFPVRGRGCLNVV